MGYKYGIWLVYDNREFSTAHIGHFTITCFMEKEEATLLYKELIKMYGKTHQIWTICTKAIEFELNMYKDDNNNIHSWGYEGHTVTKEDIWLKFEQLANKYNCNFSQRIHTSIEYSTDKQLLRLVDLPANKLVSCSIELVDITSNNPLEWSIIDDIK